MAEFDPQFLNFRGRRLFVGQWLAGDPVGDWAFTKLPTVPPLSDALAPRERLDVRTAGAALARKPRLLFDAWRDVRGALVGFIAADERLRKQGYGSEALQRALWKESGEELSLTLREAADEAFGAAELIRSSREKLGQEYFEPEETEAERALRDLAIAEMYRAAQGTDRILLRLKNDPRLLAAVSRVPRVLTDLADHDLAAMRAEYLQVYYPHSTKALSALADTVNESVRDAIYSGLIMLEMGCGPLPFELVADWGGAAAWILDTEAARNRRIAAGFGQLAGQGATAEAAAA